MMYIHAHPGKHGGVGCAALQRWRVARTTEEHGDVQGDVLRGPKPLCPLGKSGSRPSTSSHRISRAGAGVAPALQQCLRADTRQGDWAHSCGSTQAVFIPERVAFHSSCFFLPSASSIRRSKALLATHTLTNLRPQALLSIAPPARGA